MANRRDALKGLVGTLGVFGVRPLSAALPVTPAQSKGPFYPRTIPSDHDNDLTRVHRNGAVAKGQRTDLTGRVLDTTGTPIEGARIEIWQCNAFGRYHHPREQSAAPLDPGFQGFGTTLTDALGGYRFKTIKPVPYPGRTPHIHFLVAAPKKRTLITQLYVAGDPNNANDVLFRRGSSAPSLLAAHFESVEDGAWRAHFDIVIR